MSIANLIFKTRVRIGVGASDEFLPYGAVELDASIEETHNASNEITQFPVEEGVDITDHVRKQADRVTIRGIVSDHPIYGISGRSGAVAPTAQTGRAADAYEKMYTMLEEAQLVSVVTSLRQYQNMVIESMEVPRDSKRGNAVEMVVSLRELKTATVATTAGTSNLGTQNTTVVT